MRGVLHAEVFGFNFSADINPYQRSDDCVIAAGQITERPRRLSKTSADAPETERGTQVGGTHEHTSMCLSSSEMWLTRSIARNHVQSLVFFLKGVYEGRSLQQLLFCHSRPSHNITVSPVVEWPTPISPTRTIS